MELYIEATGALRMSSEIWVLGDSRVGNTNQAVALAEKLALEYEVKPIKYNIFGKVPNFILMISPFHVKKNILKTLENQIPPKLIISAGRRTAPLALYLKRKFNNGLKVVQIMNPGGCYNKFDLIILPQHDYFTGDSSNVLRIIGALSNIQSKIKTGAQELQKYYPEIKKFIAVIIGGDTKNNKFTKNDATSLTAILSEIVDNHPYPLFISFSRRTPTFLKQTIKENFPWPHTIYDPLEGGYNPYFGMLSLAEHIICTADSISMCSEAASSGKPLYIFYPPEFQLKKHKFFIQQLMDLGVARRLDDSTNFLENYSYTPLNEVGDMAKFIKSEVLQMKKSKI